MKTLWLLILGSILAGACYWQGRKDANKKIFDIIDTMNVKNKRPIIHDIVGREA